MHKDTYLGEKGNLKSFKKLRIVTVCVGSLRKVLLYETERVLQKHSGFSCIISLAYDSAVLL